MAADFEAIETEEAGRLGLSLFCCALFQSCGRNAVND